MNKVVRKIFLLTSVLLLFFKISSMELEEENLDQNKLSSLPPEIIEKFIFPELIKWDLDEPAAMLRNLMRLEQVCKSIRLLIKNSKFKISNVFLEITNHDKTLSNNFIQYDRLKRNIFELFFQQLYFEKKFHGKNKIQNKSPMMLFFIKPPSIEKLRACYNVQNFLELIKDATKKILDSSPSEDLKNALKLYVQICQETSATPEDFISSNPTLQKSILLRDKSFNINDFITIKL